MCIWRPRVALLVATTKWIPCIRKYTAESHGKKTTVAVLNFILEQQRIFRENRPVKELIPLTKLGYDEYVKSLRPNSELEDCVINYIYNQSGILTPKFNALYKGTFGVLQSRLNSVLKENDIPTGHFQLEESNSIIKNWNGVCDIVGFSDSEKTMCIEKFDSIHPRSNNRYKKHLLGIYLGKDIMRHGLSSYEIWRRICFKRKMSRFSKEEEELILRRVEELGKSTLAFQIISKELGRFYCVSVRNRYKELTQNSSPMYHRGPFTEAEDKFILEHVKECGENAKTFNAIASKIGRKHGRNIKYRYFKLKYGTLSEAKNNFTPEDQERLIRVILKEYPNTELRYMKPNDAFFTNLYPVFKRDSSILEKHWLKVILPALLSHHHGILNQNWQTSLISTLLDWAKQSKIKIARDIDYIELLQLFPGQTKQSLQHFITVMLTNVAKKLNKNDSSIEEILEEALRLNYSGRSPRVTTVQRNNLIVDIYKKIKEDI